MRCLSYQSRFTPRSDKTRPRKFKNFDLDADFHKCDVEDMPFEDASFDVVVSQFGNMFTPRPSVALSEMFRVLSAAMLWSMWRSPLLFFSRPLS